MKYDPPLQLKLFLQGHQEEREDARQSLLAMGEQAVPYVIEALEREKYQERGYIRPLSAALSLAELLVEFGDPRSLVSLLNMGYVENNPYRSGLFLKVVQVLEQRAEKRDILALIDLLQHSEPAWKQRGLQLVMAPPDRVAVAKALVMIAERDPLPELRAVLPLLRYRTTAPLGFIRLHKRLKIALGAESLPIPVTGVRTTEHLPIPAEDEMR